MSEQAMITATFIGRLNVYSGTMEMSTDLPADALGELCATVIEAGCKAGEDPCGCALTLAFFKAEEEQRADPVEETKKIMAALEPAVKSDPSMYRVTPEQKAFGDKRVAENVRYYFHGTDKLAGYTDEQVADAYERWRDDDTNDPNMGDPVSRTAFKELLADLYDADPEPGEHQVVIDAIDGCNDGEER